MKKVKMQKGGSLEKDYIDYINKAKNSSKVKSTSQKIKMSPSLQAVPGSRKPYTPAQKDSLLKSWGIKK